ncbi:MAG: hypothetical protein GF317_07735 [Candidatus Lokiarchaeota archaeon]|nr:hypothetical protein [Candidatus Lokiarchaeota archaeon]MBD3199603.1 hypothetical protein [Candidatus Lokiarchaeota archaeon]
MQSIVQFTVIRRVFKPNKGKLLNLNRNLDQYINCVRWYLSFKTTSKKSSIKMPITKQSNGLNSKPHSCSRHGTKQWKSIRLSGK